MATRLLEVHGPERDRAGVAARVRLMHVVDRLDLAGMEYGVIKLVNALDPARYEPSICCLGTASEAARSLLEERIPVYELRRKPGRNYALVPRLRDLLRRERIDVVHSHNWATFAYTALAASWASTTVRIHGEHGRETAAPDARWRRRAAERCLSRSFHHLTAVSPHIAQVLIEAWGVSKEKVTYVPNGVDLARFGVVSRREEVRSELGIDASAPWIGSIGRFRPVKDYPMLLRAFATVRSSFPDAVLALVGADSDPVGARALREQGRELGLPPERLLLLDRRPVPEFLSALDVYVNSSIYEGMSNTILEAMASRLPVVATRVGGTPDLVVDGESGWLVPPRDPERLADRLIDLLSDPVRARAMGRAGRARVETRHGYTRMIQSYADLYEGLVASRGCEGSRRGRE